MGRHTTDECDGCHRFRKLTYFDDQGWLCKNCKEDIDCFGYTIGDCEETIAESYNTIDQLRSRIGQLETLLAIAQDTLRKIKPFLYFHSGADYEYKVVTQALDKIEEVRSDG